MPAPVSAAGSGAATGWAGWPCSRACGRRTRTRRPPSTRHRPGRAPKVTSSQSTSAARARASSNGYRSPPPYNPSDPNAVGATWMTRILTVSLVTLGDPGRLTGGYRYHRRMAELAPACGAIVRFVSFPERPFPLSTLAGPAVLRRATADVLVLDSIAAAFLGPWLPLRHRMPLVGSLHQPPGGIDHGPLRRGAQAPLDRLAYRRARLLLVASQALGDELAAQGYPRERIRVVPPGRDLPAAPAGQPVDLRRGRRAGLLCVANWVQRKGILELLEAVARLPDGLATLHLAGRVVVHGPLSAERVAALYLGADVFVLPSLREPYGTVWGEAMAAGLPVVGWRAGNLPHLATDGREGLLADPGDVAGLSRALARLAGDEDLRRRMAAAAGRRAADRPTWAQSAALFFAALREAAAPRHDDGLAVPWADLLQVLPLDPGGDGVQRRPQRVQVADHAVLVELGPADHDVDPVVVGVKLPLGPFHGLPMEGPDRDARPHLVPDAHRRTSWIARGSSPVSQGGMQQAILFPVHASEGLGGPLEGELVGGQDGQGKLAGEPPCHLGTAAAVPPGGEGSRERGDLGAADGQPSAVEGGAEREGSRLGAVPRADQRRSLMGQQPQGRSQGLRVATGLHHQVGPSLPRPGGHRPRDLVGRDRPHAEGGGHGPPGGLRFRAEHRRPRTRQ